MDIQALWNDIITQNRNNLSSHFNIDAVILWPCTNEQFTVDEYIRANCDYPGAWKGEIEKLVELGDRIILVGHVHSIDNLISCHVVSFIDIKGEKIIRMEEYWSDDGDAPTWRKEMRIGRPIESGR